jgi:hypothetical protein
MVFEAAGPEPSALSVQATLGTRRPWSMPHPESGQAPGEGAAGTARVRLRPVDLRKAVDEAISSVTAHAAAARTTLVRGHITGRARTDPELLHVVLVNLLLHTIDAVGAGGTVAVNLARRDPGWLWLEVGGSLPAGGAAPRRIVESEALAAAREAAHRVRALLEARSGAAHGAEFVLWLQQA